MNRLIDVIDMTDSTQGSQSAGSLKEKIQMPQKFSASEVAKKIDRLKQVIERCRSGQPGDHQEWKQDLMLLHQFECWDIYFKHIDRYLASGSSEDTKQYFQQVLTVTFNVTEDPAKASDYLVKASKQLKMPFNLFWRLMILETMKYKNYHIEAQVLENLGHQSEGEFFEKILERLALIYEEKLYREDLIYETFSRLLEANRENRKALIFFKNFSMQRQEWSKVEVFLKALIDVLADTPEEANYRLELARLYFHYLDEGDTAIEVMKGIEPEAGYRVFKAKFMLLFQSGEFKHGLPTLKVLEQLAETPRQLSHVYFHFARVYSNLNQMGRAFKYYERSLSKDFNVVVARKYGATSAQYSYYGGIYRMLRHIIKNADRKSQRDSAERLIKKFRLKDEGQRGQSSQSSNHR